MLIEFSNLSKYGITPRGVIHVGMHKAEEYAIYKTANVQKICFIEANPKLCEYSSMYVIGKDSTTDIINAAISDVGGQEVELKITNNFESSSILDLKEHSKIYPHIVEVERIKMKTNTLDQVIGYYKEDVNLFNVLNLDIQGVELRAMKGLTNWSNIEAVFTEVNYKEMYAGCNLIDEITEFLSCKGFKKAEEVDTGCGWGDALYIKN